MLAYAVFLAILQTQPVTTIEINPTDTEWTAPGVVVEELARVDLLAYGEPMNVGDESGRPHLACQAFFIDTEEGVRWRVVVVYRDKVVVLDQNCEPREIYPGYDDCRYAVFSPNGRYVLVGAEVGTEQAPECVYTLLGIEDASALRFPRTFAYGREPVFWVADDGSVAFLAHARAWIGYQAEDAFTARGKDTLYMFDSEADLEWKRSFDTTPLIRASESLERFIISDGNGLSALDSSGDGIWQVGIEPSDSDGNSQHYATRVSKDGSVVLVSDSDGIAQYDGSSGDYINGYSEYTVCHSHAVSDSGAYWAAVYLHPIGGDPFDYVDREYLVTWSNDEGHSWVSEIRFAAESGSFLAGFGHILSVFEDGTKYMVNPVDGYPGMQYYCLLRADNDLIWVSNTLHEPSIAFSGNIGANWWRDSKPISARRLHTATYILAYLDANELAVIRISPE